MRDHGQQPGLGNPNTDPQLEGGPALLFTRTFCPDALDLDALAYAIQQLLQGSDCGPPNAALRPKSHLLSRRNRASHVVEATEAR